MKKLLLSILTLCCLNVFAQEETGLLTTRKTALDRDYMRPSISRVVLYDGSELAGRAAKMFLEAEAPDRYDVNDIGVEPIRFSNANAETNFRSEIESVIKNQRVGNRIMKVWFPTFSAENGYGIDVLLKRGEYAATDNDVLKQDASQRKTMLYELGEKLINRSYCMIAFIADSTYTDNKGNVHKRVCLREYLYKLDYNQEVQNDFYTKHYMNAGGIDAMNFPMRYVRSGILKTDIEGIVKYLDKNGRTQTKLVSNDLSGGFNEMLDGCEKNVADFQVKVAVVSVNPISAKIGTKESLGMDRRYSVMEYKQKNNGEQVATRVATVRSCKVADNKTVATGHTDNLSEFYYIKGSAVQPGMTLVESKDAGLITDVKYGLTGFDISIGYRFSKHFRSKIVGFFAYFDLGLVNSENGELLKVQGYKLDKDKEGNDLSTGEWKELSSLRLSVGFAKEFNFLRCLVLTPIMEFGFWGPGGDKIILSDDGKNASPAPKDSKEGGNGTGFYMSPIVQFGYMVTRNVQIYGETGFSIYTKNAEYKWMRDYYAQENDTDPADPQSFRLGIGARIYF